jgi:hypothetical protein
MSHYKHNQKKKEKEKKQTPVWYTLHEQWLEFEMIGRFGAESFESFQGNIFIKWSLSAYNGQKAAEKVESLYKHSFSNLPGYTAAT